MPGQSGQGTMCSHRISLPYHGHYLSNKEKEIFDA